MYVKNKKILFSTIWVYDKCAHKYHIFIYNIGIVDCAILWNFWVFHSSKKLISFSLRTREHIYIGYFVFLRCVSTRVKVLPDGLLNVVRKTKVFFFFVKNTIIIIRAALRRRFQNRHIARVRELMRWRSVSKFTNAYIRYIVYSSIYLLFYFFNILFLRYTFLWLFSRS